MPLDKIRALRARPRPRALDHRAIAAVLAAASPRRRRSGSRRLTRRAALVSVVGLAFVATVGVAAGEIIGTKNAGHLTAFGPVSETDGFPVWYKDDAGKKLEFCLDQNEPLCGFLPGDVPDESKPISFPDNWPGEIFYFLAGSEVTPPGGGSIDATLGLEATFANGEPIDGDQMVFGRVRFVGKDLQPRASYTITHPYGVDKFTTDDDGAFKFVEDIGISPGQFGGALNSRIGPFLRWDPNVAPAAPAGYVGDPNVEHAITGSPFDTNVLKACVTPVGGTESCAENTQFTIQGKYATNGGVEPARATYTRSATDGGTIDVFATSDLGPQSIEVSGTGVDPTRLGGEQGRYAAHVAFTGAPPTSVKLTNVSDAPASTKSVDVTDGISGTAVYDADKDTLTVDAKSTDTAAPPTLTAQGFGDLTSGHLLVESVPAPPASVTVKSSAAGTVDLPVTIDGKADAAIPVAAFAGVDQQVVSGVDVKLDGTGSTGPVKSYAWQQIDPSDPQVTLSGADTATPGFKAPTLAADQEVTLTFELTVTGSGGPSTSTVKVRVRGSAPAAVAKAGDDQSVDQNAVVTLDGSASTETTKFQWKQTGGPAVTLTGDTTAKPTFRAPKTATTFTFELTASGAGGSSTDVVQVTTRPDVLSQPTVEYRTSKREWRINGTSSVAGPGVTITIYLGPTASGTVLASPGVDTLGAWQFRNTGPAPDARTPRISIKSSSGGERLNIPVSVRN